MTVLDFSLVLELKRFVSGTYGGYVHFHDACGGQYFNLEEPDEKAKEGIISFLKNKNLKAVFESDDVTFTVE